MSKNRSNKNGTKNDDWATPDYLLDMIRDEFGEFFDPCPLNAKFDGLKVTWKKVNFINPPYSLTKKRSFVKKAIVEASQGKTCILLIPVTTETKIFMDLWNTADEIRFLHKRVKFKGYNTKGEYVTDKTGQGGSMLVILKGQNRPKPKINLVIHDREIGGTKDEMDD